MRVQRLQDPCVNLTSSHLSRKQSEAQKLRQAKGKRGAEEGGKAGGKAEEKELTR